MNRPPYQKDAGIAELFGKAQAIYREIGKELNDVPLTGGGSDGNFTAALGIPTLDGLGADGKGAHAAYEQIYYLLADAAHLSLRAAAGDARLTVAIGHVVEAQIPEAYQHVRPWRGICPPRPDLPAWPRVIRLVKKARGLLWLLTGLGRSVAMGLGVSRRDETAAANSILAFAAGVVAAPNFSDRTAEDAPDDFERSVSTIEAHVAGLPLSLPTLARIAYGLEPLSDADWGPLAAELRQNYLDLSDLHFAGVALAAVEAIRDRALSMPAGTLVDSSARLRLFAMGLGVAPERREAIRALLLLDIDILLSVRRPACSSSVKSDGGDGRVAGR